VARDGINRQQGNGAEKGPTQTQTEWLDVKVVWAGRYIHHVPSRQQQLNNGPENPSNLGG